MYPDEQGQIVLAVQVRGATSLQWTKNGLALKEGADGGRISGVNTEILTIHRMLGRDEAITLLCVAKNKFGIVKSHQVKIRLNKDEPVDEEAAKLLQEQEAVRTASEKADAAKAEEEEDDDSDDEGTTPRSKKAIVSLVAPVAVTASM